MASIDRIHVRLDGCVKDNDGVSHIIDQKMCGDTVFCVAIDHENDFVRGCANRKFDDDSIAVTLAVLIGQIGVHRAIKGMVRALKLHELKEVEGQAHE